MMVRANVPIADRRYWYFCSSSLALLEAINILIEIYPKPQAMINVIQNIPAYYGITPCIYQGTRRVKMTITMDINRKRLACQQSKLLPF